MWSWKECRRRILSLHSSPSFAKCNAALLDLNFLNHKVSEIKIIVSFLKSSQHIHVHALIFYLLPLHSLSFGLEPTSP